MIPCSHILILAVIEFFIGLIGVLIRRAGIVVLTSAIIMLNGVLLAFCALPKSQTSGLVMLALIVSLALAGGAILYSFYCFRRVVSIEAQDRMKN